MKRLLVIQEHDADRAGLHWDIRFEHYGELESYIRKRASGTNEPIDENDTRVLKSFAVPKARLPDVGEKLLAIPTEDHPWSYKDFEGEITGGYGKGPVKLVFSDYVEVSELSDAKIKFTYDEKNYSMFYVAKMRKWLITGVT